MEERNQTLQMLDSFCGQVSKQPSEQHHSQAPEWTKAFCLLGGGYCSHLKAPEKSYKGEHIREAGLCVPFPCQLLSYRHMVPQPGAVPSHDTLNLAYC